MRPLLLDLENAKPVNGSVTYVVLWCRYGSCLMQYLSRPYLCRACRNAIEFNSIPSINSLVPGGYDNMLLRVQLAVPTAAEDIDLDAVAQVFPYGKLLPIEVSDVLHLVLQIWYTYAIYINLFCCTSCSDRL
jgi:Conserved hypothetical protein (Lin0512_fam)